MIVLVALAAATSGAAIAMAAADGAAIATVSPGKPTLDKT
jgi:hypothetical protein